MRLCTVKRGLFSSTAVAVLLAISACTQLKQPEPEPYFAETPAPPKQELRWSNGKSPKSLDPAKAAAPPETDITRALYEGLTELDPKTLNEIPGVAEKWEPSDDNRTWRFFLREDALWSNGKPVTAQDFVRSWTRLTELGDDVAHRGLLLNIKGMQKKGDVSANPAASVSPDQSNANSAASPSPGPAITPAPAPQLGIVAESDRVLRVELFHPDKDFPKLVSHPIFRPVFDNGKTAEKEKPVTNGAFSLSGLSPENVVLTRSENYWGRDAVKLDLVQFVSMPSPEKALEAYRSGQVDVVTNAEYAPAALKLLEPFEDFRRVTHSALNFYELNATRVPFNDRRVRQALAIAIERDKLAEGELQGITRPATGFLSQGSQSENRLSLDVQQARSLLESAGFPDGKGFPVIRLLINRNDTQQRVARSVVQMWKQNLNIDTVIVIVEPSELEAARARGDYDAIRRGVVMPTMDEAANFLSIFGSSDSRNLSEPIDGSEGLNGFRSGDSNSGPAANAESGDSASPDAKMPRVILTEDEALYELRAIPLYFPTSYSLVKPYVKGFDSNTLDSPSLKSVEIDQNWRAR